jgi:hypothetical protein
MPPLESQVRPVRRHAEVGAGTANGFVVIKRTPNNHQIVARKDGPTLADPRAKDNNHGRTSGALIRRKGSRENAQIGRIIYRAAAARAPVYMVNAGGTFGPIVRKPARRDGPGRALRQEESPGGTGSPSGPLAPIALPSARVNPLAANVTLLLT